MLTDTGPLVSLLDKDDFQHAACLAVLRDLPRGPLLTTWPCFTEAMYLLGLVGGHRYQSNLWLWRRDGRLTLLDLTQTEAERMDALMAQYTNVPMDLADASLVALAESRDHRRLFTIDSDFYIYRLADNSVLEVVR
jgi:predicted nucleic acid-binding protein